MRYLLALLTIGIAYPATYTVKAGGGGDYTTIQACANVTAAGDTCAVYAGAYAENVTVPTSGTSGNPISYVVNSGDAVSVLGITVTGKDYITIGGATAGTGFEVTGGTTLIVVSNTSHVIIRNNYIHHGAVCVRCVSGATSSYLTIQGNMMSWCGSPPVTPLEAMQIRGDHILIEGNTVTHVPDFVTLYGVTDLVVRGNTFGPTSVDDFPGTSNPLHIDGVQAICAASATIADVLIEGNVMLGVDVDDSHLALFQGDTVGMCGQRSIVRGNLVANSGGPYAVINDRVAYKPVKIYNNTVHNAGLRVSAVATFNFSDGNTGGAVINNLLYNATTNNGSGYGVDAGSLTGFVGKNNLAYISSCGAGCIWADPINSETGVVKNQDPLLTNYHPQSGSPARGTGTYLTTVAVADTGTGTSLVVADAGFFQDGFGIVDADYIRVGSTAFVQIASIDYATNTITLTNSIPRSDGDGVYLYRNSSGVGVLSGENPDIGAYQYAAPQPPTTLRGTMRGATIK